MTSASGERLLEVRDLAVTFTSGGGPVSAVHSVSFNVAARERLAIVGESGSGKSVTALATMGLVRPPGRIERGSISWRGRDMRDPLVAQAVRGREIAMIFQDPMSSLNPLMTVERQIREVLERRLGMPGPAARNRTMNLLDMVGLSFVQQRMKQYPFELSGGMCQRVVIAMALASSPMLLIADEPTTALDVTIQAQILELLRGLSDELDVAVMLITHDLGVVAEFCDRAQVMYAGRIVERAPLIDLFTQPLHPYTRCLLQSAPRLDQRASLEGIMGDPPEHADAVPGCPFHPRCPEANGQCRVTDPALVRLTDKRRWVACWACDAKAL
jgi:oligopeptide transport system ATP-binding protein